MKVLIADDSAALRMMIVRTIRLAGYNGHEFVEAANGQEALDKVDTARPDLILLDWNMPEVSGIEVLRRLRKQGLRTPVGFVTSEGSEEMRRIASEAGAMFLISKPFTVDSFQMALDMVMP